MKVVDDDNDAPGSSHRRLIAARDCIAAGNPLSCRLSKKGSEPSPRSPLLSIVWNDLPNLLTLGRIAVVVIIVLLAA